MTWVAEALQIACWTRTSVAIKAGRGEKSLSRTPVAQFQSLCTGGGDPLCAPEDGFGISFWMGPCGCHCACVVPRVADLPHSPLFALRAEGSLLNWEVLQQVNVIANVKGFGGTKKKKKVVRWKNVIACSHHWKIISALWLGELNAEVKPDLENRK